MRNQREDFANQPNLVNQVVQNISRIILGEDISRVSRSVNLTQLQ